jgi:hypothetical protein
MRNRAKTLDELNEKYGIKDLTIEDGKIELDPIYKKHIDKSWEIQNVYNLVGGEQISLGKARELTAAIIESSLPDINKFKNEFLNAKIINTEHDTDSDEVEAIFSWITERLKNKSNESNG